MKAGRKKHRLFLLLFTVLPLRVVFPEIQRHKKRAEVFTPRPALSFLPLPLPENPAEEQTAARHQDAHAEQREGHTAACGGEYAP